MPIPGSQATALEVIKSSLRTLGVLASGEEPDPAMAQDCLVSFNQMIDSWNADGLMMFTLNIDDFPLSAAKQIYSYGPGGDFNKARPAFIDRASIVLLSNPAQPLEYPIQIYTTQDWQEKIPIKNIPGNLPLLIYDDGSFPLRYITFWPKASDNILFRSYTWAKLSQFANLQTVGAYPEGYQEALKYNLAVRLSSDFPGSQLPQATAILAISSLATIKSQNADDTQLHSDLRSSYDASRMRSELFNIP